MGNLTTSEAMHKLSPLRKGYDNNRDLEFLKEDFTTSPNYKLHHSQAQQFASLRTEYNTEADAYLPLKRSLIGKPFSY